MTRKAQYNIYIIFVVGVILRFVVEVSQHELGDGIEHIIANNGWAVRAIFPPVTYVYIAMNTVVTVALWRGEWLLLDELETSLLEDKNKVFWKPAFHAWVLCFALMIVMYLRSSISLIACPLGVSSDSRDDVYNAPSLHNRTLTNATYFSFLCDIVLSIIVICLSVIVWWSTWNLADDITNHIHSVQKVLYINNNSNSKETPNYHWGSMALGYTLCGSVYLLQVGTSFHLLGLV